MKEIPIEIILYVIENAIYIDPDELELESESDNDSVTSEEEFNDWEII